MDKKDIYEHLAKIYLDASSDKKKKSTPKPPVFKNIFIVSTVFVIALSAILLKALQERGGPLNSEVALVFLSEPARINFHFDPAKKEIFSMDLKKLNLSRYKALGFAVKKASYQDNISLRVEFSNAFKEKSEVYLKDIPHKWHDYIVNLSEFKNLNDWSEMAALSFTVEEWNAKEKRGLVSLDNVRVLK